MWLAVRGVPEIALRTHSAQQAPLWGSLVTCVVHFCACASVRALFLCFYEYAFTLCGHSCLSAASSSRGRGPAC